MVRGGAEKGRGQSRQQQSREGGAVVLGEAAVLRGAEKGRGQSRAEKGLRGSCDARGSYGARGN